MPSGVGKAMVESILKDSVPAASKPSTKTKPKLSLSAPSLKPISNFSSMKAAPDAGLVFVTSPKVGLFRKGRTVRGKSGPSLCEETCSRKQWTYARRCLNMPWHSRKLINYS